MKSPVKLAKGVADGAGVLRKPSILIVEPDHILASSYCNFLAKFGYLVQVADSAQGAIEAIDKNPPNLIILELQLRLHNGIELLNELQSYGDLKNIPVVVLSFIPERLVFTQAFMMKQYRVARYFYKPTTSLSDLKSALEEILES